MLCGETRLQADQAFVADRQLALEGTAQAHVQVVQALRLLAQAFAGMAQAAGDAFQAQAFAQQLVAHAQHQAPAQAVETLLQVAGVGRQQFGGGRRRRARASATKSLIDTSVSWPTALTIGVAQAATARATASSLKHQRSSGNRRPGQDQRVEALPVGQLQRADDLRDGLAALHCGGHQGQLDLRCAAAKHADDVADHRPLGELTIPMRRGWAGSGRLRSLANRPSPASFSFNASKARRRAPSPAGSTVSAISW